MLPEGVALHSGRVLLNVSIIKLVFELIFLIMITGKMTRFIVNEVVIYLNY